MKVRNIARTCRRLASLAAVPLAMAWASPGVGAQPPRRGEATTAEGVVERMTTAPRGEIDGAVLSDGTILHWPPHLAERFAAAATRGDRVRASGWMETGPRGDTHFEVQTLTNLRTEATAENDGPPPPRPGAREPRRGRGPETDRRIQDLEAQIDRLKAELDRLRRDR